MDSKKVEIKELSKFLQRIIVEEVNILQEYINRRGLWRAALIGMVFTDREIKFVNLHERLRKAWKKYGTEDVY